MKRIVSNVEGGLCMGAIGNDDDKHLRQTLFDPGNRAQRYHSMKTDVQKRIRYLEMEAA